MKSKIIISVIIVATLFMSFSCSSVVENGQDHELSDEQIEFKECELSSLGSFSVVFDYMVIPFLESVSEHSKCCNAYLIRGVALNDYKYGRQIRFVEDLKGNFPKNINTFMVWGGSADYKITWRYTNIQSYCDQDVLIMHLLPAEEYNLELPQGVIWYEKPGDYCTFTFTSSVLKLYDGYVNGFISPEVYQMSWENLQEKIKEIYKENK
jgi:hypothetical protein